MVLILSKHTKRSGASPSPAPLSFFKPSPIPAAGQSAEAPRTSSGFSRLSRSAPSRSFPHQCQALLPAFVPLPVPGGIRPKPRKANSHSRHNIPPVFGCPAGCTQCEGCFRKMGFHRPPRKPSPFAVLDTPKKTLPHRPDMPDGGIVS